MRRSLVPIAILMVMAASAMSSRAAAVPAHSFIVYGGLYAPGDNSVSLNTLVLPEGSTLDVTNLDVGTAPHSITSMDCVDPLSDPCVPLFDSGDLGRGSSGPVAGVAALSPGVYQFWCDIHPFMRGTLEIDSTS